MARKIGSELDELRKNLKIDITSILFASSDGFSERELIKEYAQVRGKYIPFTTLGYATIFDMMRDTFMKDSVRIEKHRSGTTWIYHGIHNEATRALGDMVRNQADNFKQKREMHRASERCYSERILQARYSTTSQIHAERSGPVGASLQKEIEEILRGEPDFKMTDDSFEVEFVLIIN